MQFLEVETWRIQGFSIVSSLFFLGSILWLIKARRLREEYSLLWLSSGIVIFVISVWRGGLVWLASLLGVAYAPAALFVVFVGAITLLLLHFSVVLSRHREEIRTLIQELALLRSALDHERVLSSERTPREDRQ